LAARLLGPSAAVPHRPQDLAVQRWGALAVPNYRTYFAVSAVSQSGGWLLRTAQSWLVLDLTGSPAALGVLALFQFLPITLLTLFAGVVIDRVPSRRLLIATQLVIGLQAGVLGALVLLQRVEYWHVLVLAAVLGIASAFDQPARSVFVSQLVGPRRIGNAVALNSAVANGARIIGPGLGGVMIALWGTGMCFSVAALAFLIALAGLFALREDQFHPKRQAGRGAVLGQLWDGVRYSFSSPSLGFNFVLMAFIGTFAYNWGLVLPLLARYALDGGPQGFGALNIAMGLGSVLGGLLLATRLKPSARLVAISAGIYSVLVGLVGLAPSMAVALGLLVAAGVLSIVYSASSNTLLQLEAREEYRGRVLALYMLLFAGSTPIGSAVTGVVSDHWDIRVALTVNAAVCVVGVLVAVVYVVLAHARASTNRSWAKLPPRWSAVDTARSGVPAAADE
jgi:MFS family permease